MFKFKLDKEIVKSEELDFIKDYEIQYKDGHLIFITYSNENYHEGLLLIERDNDYIEAIPSEFEVDELHNIKGHKRVNGSTGLEMLDIFLNFNVITKVDIQTAKMLLNISNVNSLEYENDYLIRSISDNLAIRYKLELSDYCLNAYGALYDIENNKKLTGDIFYFSVSGEYEYEELEYLFEIFHPKDLNETIV